MSSASSHTHQTTRCYVSEDFPVAALGGALDSSGQGQVVVSCEHDDGPLSSRKDRVLLTTNFLT